MGFNSHKGTEGKASGLHEFVTRVPPNRAEPLDALHSVYVKEGQSGRWRDLPTGTGNKKAYPLLSRLWAKRKKYS